MAQKEITQLIGTQKITQPLNTKKLRNISTQKNQRNQGYQGNPGNESNQSNQSNQGNQGNQGSLNLSGQSKLIRAN